MMNIAEILEQRRKLVQQELECWTTVREKLTERIVNGTDTGGPSLLAYVQALEIAVNAEGRALDHVGSANIVDTTGF